MSIKSILQTTLHRQYPLPDCSWQHYQEWDGNIMMHWKADAAQLRNCIPAGLDLDLYEGNAYVSIIAFTVKNLRPRFFFPLPFLSSFREVNVRTYVVRDGKPGIYFLSIAAGKLLPAMLARMVTGLPYKIAAIEQDDLRYTVRNATIRLDIEYSSGQNTKPDELDYWLTERHCLYQLKEERLLRIDIHYKPWKLKKCYLRLKRLSCRFCKGVPLRLHYSPKQKVILWKPTPINE